MPRNHDTTGLGQVFQDVAFAAMTRNPALAEGIRRHLLAVVSAFAPDQFQSCANIGVRRLPVKTSTISGGWPFQRLAIPRGAVRRRRVVVCMNSSSASSGDPAVRIAS